MRWLTQRMRDERGATAVLVGILMIPLLGFAAILVDVGALYAERAQLQNGADAAALAIAQECAEDSKCDAPSALAASFANQNSNDGTSNVLTPTFPTAISVLVTTSTRDAATGAPALSHPFAQFIGIDASTVGAKATAEWGALRSAKTLPLAISLCDFTDARSPEFPSSSATTRTRPARVRAAPRFPAGSDGSTAAASPARRPSISSTPACRANQATRTQARASLQWRHSTTTPTERRSLSPSTTVRTRRPARPSGSTSTASPRSTSWAGSSRATVPCRPLLT